MGFGAGGISMNMQDLINKYTAKNEELRPNCPNRNRKNEELKRSIYEEIIEDLEQIYEQEKVVVSKWQLQCRWYPMNRRQFIIIMIMVVVALSCLTYTIIDQQKKINQLEKQLQEVQLKYEIIKNDPLAKDAFEAGG